MKGLLLEVGDDVEQRLADLGEGGGVDDAHRVVDGMPHGAETGVAVAAHIDDVDTGNACLVDKDMVIGHGTALGVDEVAACSVFPYQVNKTVGIIL